MGSISDGAFEILRWLNPSGRTKVQGPTRSLTEMNTRDLRWEVKAAGA